MAATLCFGESKHWLVPLELAGKIARGSDDPRSAAFGLARCVSDRPIGGAGVMETARRYARRTPEQLATTAQF